MSGSIPTSPGEAVAQAGSGQVSSDEGVGEAVLARLGVAVGVDVAVFVGVGISVAVAVFVGVGVGVAEFVSVGVAEFVSVGVAEFVSVGVAVFVPTGAAVGSAVLSGGIVLSGATGVTPVAVCVGVGEGVFVGLALCVGVGVVVVMIVGVREASGVAVAGFEPESCTPFAATGIKTASAVASSRWAAICRIVVGVWTTARAGPASIALARGKARAAWTRSQTSRVNTSLFSLTNR